MAALKKFEWRKVASLTQDGSKYSHYMSSLQDEWKRNGTGIDFILNRKFPRDTKDMSLVNFIISIKINVYLPTTHDLDKNFWNFQLNCFILWNVSL